MLIISFQRLVVENDQLRTVLVNHCINVPPHQPITGKRQPRKQLLNRPPSFVPPGRPKSRGGSHHTASSPNLSVSSKSSDLVPHATRVSESQERSSDELTPSAKSPEAIAENVRSNRGSRSSKRSREATPSSQGDEQGLVESGSEMSDYEEEGEGENHFGRGSIEHIVFEDAVETPTSITPITQVCIHSHPLEYVVR